MGEGRGGLSALPPWASAGPPHPIHCIGPRGPGGVRSSELPLGLGAVQLGPESPSCSAPAWCPNARGATSMIDWRASAPPLCPTETPPCSTPPPKLRAFLREQMSDRQAHGQTHNTHMQPGQVRQTTDTSSPARARVIAPRRGRGQRKGWEARYQETQSQKETKVQRQTQRWRGGDRHVCEHTQLHTDTHTRRHRQREGDTEPLTDGKRETDTGERMASDPRQTHWHPP